MRLILNYFLFFFFFGIHTHFPLSGMEQQPLTPRTRAIIQLSQQVDTVTAVVIAQDAQLRTTQNQLTDTQSQVNDIQAALIDLLKEKNVRLKAAEKERIVQAKNSKPMAIAQQCALGAVKLGIFRTASVMLKQYSQTMMPDDFLTNEILPDLCATVVAQQAPQLVWKLYEGLGTMTNRCSSALNTMLDPCIDPYLQKAAWAWELYEVNKLLSSADTLWWQKIFLTEPNSNNLSRIGKLYKRKAALEKKPEWEESFDPSFRSKCR